MKNLENGDVEMKDKLNRLLDRMKQDLKLAIEERVKILPYQVWDDIQDYTTKIKLLESYVTEIEKALEDDVEEIDECVFCESEYEVYRIELRGKIRKVCQVCSDKI